MAIRQKHTLQKGIFWLVYVAVIAACVVIDQLSKHFIDLATQVVNPVTQQITTRRDIPLIGDWLLLHWTTNDGATGGIFSNMENRNILFFVMTVVGLPVFVFMLWRSRTRSVWGQVAFAFIIGGTIGNAIDRLFLAESGFFTGAVRDFVQVTWFFGIFNMADSFLVVGVFSALLAILFFDYDGLVPTIIQERKSKAATIQVAEPSDTQAAQSVVDDTKGVATAEGDNATEQIETVDETEKSDE